MDEEQTLKGVIKPWRKLATSIALSEPWFHVRKDKVELASGKITDDYFVWESPTVATVVPVTEDGRFVLCKQYRYAVNKTMYQFPAGEVGKDETAEAAAHRELNEETGYIAKTVYHLGDSAAYPTKLSGWHHLFLADKVSLSGNKQIDSNEPTEVVLKTPEELWEMINNNEFQVADSLAAALLAFKRLGL